MLYIATASPNSAVDESSDDAQSVLYGTRFASHVGPCGDFSDKSSQNISFREAEKS